MSATTKFAIAWIVIGLMIAGLLASRNVPKLIRLTSHGGHTVGQIVEMNCKNHDSAALNSLSTALAIPIAILYKIAKHLSPETG
jgi:Na+/proline symporter